MGKYATKYPLELNKEQIIYQPTVKATLLRYMKSIEPNSAGGYVYDYINNTETAILDVGYEVDGFIWSNSDIYHLEKYDIPVTDAFLQYVLRKSSG